MASSVQGGNASGLRVREEVVFVWWWRMQTNRSLFVALVVVATAILASMLLLTMALVVWLAEWFGSIVWPCVIVGVLMLFVALVVYKVSLRDTLRDYRERLNIVYDATTTLSEIFSFGVAAIRFLRDLRKNL